jgi:hypothetical protein
MNTTLEQVEIALDGDWTETLTDIAADEAAIAVMETGSGGSGNGYC